MKNYNIDDQVCNDLAFLDQRIRELRVNLYLRNKKQLIDNIKELVYMIQNKKK